MAKWLAVMATPGDIGHRRTYTRWKIQNYRHITSVKDPALKQSMDDFQAWHATLSREHYKVRQVAEGLAKHATQQAERREGRVDQELPGTSAVAARWRKRHRQAA